jgi:hypothetical protein
VSLPRGERCLPEPALVLRGTTSERPADVTARDSFGHKAVALSSAVDVIAKDEARSCELGPFRRSLRQGGAGARGVRATASPWVNRASARAQIPPVETTGPRPIQS